MFFFKALYWRRFALTLYLVNLKEHFVKVIGDLL